MPLAVSKYIGMADINVAWLFLHRRNLANLAGNN